MIVSRSDVVRAAAVGAVALVALSGCAQEAKNSAEPASAPTGSTQSAPTASEKSMNVGTLIDVRTAEEFASGHLEGAVNIDLNSPNFADEVSKLDKNGTYTLYCRSGHRAGVAMEAMTTAGFANVSNAGGYEEASQALGLPIVK